MFGAVYGDIIGSYYEVHSTKNYGFELKRESTFTDDSVLTAAVCRAILANPDDISVFGVQERAYEYAVQYKAYYARYPYAGYGNMFTAWAKDKDMTRLKSYGNGAAMRVIPIGYAYSTLKQVKLQAKASCLYTHDHREAIRGAQAVAGSVWLARNGGTKNDIKNYAEKIMGLRLSSSVEDIRKVCDFNSRTNYSVPPAIISFLQSEDYESTVRNAVSLGGDADTMACIAGGIAEAFYGEIPKEIRTFCDNRIDYGIRMAVNEFRDKYLH